MANQVSPYIYQQLDLAYEQLQRDPQKALRLLEELLTSKQLDGYSRSLTLRLQAHGLLALNREKQAISSLKEVLTENVLEVDSLQAVRFNLGQLLLSEQQYHQAETILRQWLKQDQGNIELKRAKINGLLGSTLYYQNKFRSALSYFEQAIRSKVENRPWRRSLQRMRLSALLQLKRFSDAQLLVKQLLATETTNADYWRILISSHLQLEQYPQALNAYELYYQAGLLKSHEIMQLAQLQLAQGLPAKTARLLRDNEKQVQPDIQLQWFRLQGDAWLQAREPEEAKKSYLRVLNQSKKGSIERKLANLFLNQQAWSAAINYFRQAEQKGQQLEAVERLRLGIAYLKNKQHKLARKTFSGIQHKSYQKQADEWLKYSQR
ncbi:MAG: hypothetical protein OQK12_08810 [Motiliproteus sp.]|nr:hypothetical protein [Motiliproteus sp.]MCW9054290.1 hypothetical protein [Motiliproteus sp.]